MLVKESYLRKIIKESLLLEAVYKQKQLKELSPELYDLKDNFDFVNYCTNYSKTQNLKSQIEETEYNQKEMRNSLNLKMKNHQDVFLLIFYINV